MVHILHISGNSSTRQFTMQTGGTYSPPPPLLLFVKSKKKKHFMICPDILAAFFERKSAPVCVCVFLFLIVQLTQIPPQKCFFFSIQYLTLQSGCNGFFRQVYLCKKSFLNLFLLSEKKNFANIQIRN